MKPTFIIVHFKLVIVQDLGDWLVALSNRLKLFDATNDHINILIYINLNPSIIILFNVVLKTATIKNFV